MKPGYLEVFDGLRITTEHMEHLQQALHSAVQDLREIMGLGKVHAGFEVVAADDGQSVTVMPGLAFDLKKNRIVCDEPQAVPVAFGEGTDPLFVCARYDKVEEGRVENRPTLIWDSCRVVLHPTLPEPTDNLVPLARLDRTEEGASFTVVPLPEPETEPDESTEPEDETTGEDTTGGDTETGDETETGNESTESEEETGDETTAPEPTEPSDEDETAVRSTSEVKKERPPAATPPRPAPWPVQQGVAHLRPEQDGPDSLSALLAGPLAARLHRGGGDGALRITLAEQPIKLGFEPRDLRCHTLISATLSLTAPPGDDEEAGGETTVLTALARAEGEATFTTDQTAQHGLSTLEGEGSVLVAQRFAMTEEGIAHLPLTTLEPVSFDETAPLLGGILPAVHLLVQVASASETSFTLSTILVWQGPVTEEHIHGLSAQTATFSWHAQVAWKSIGAPDPSPT